MGEELRDAADIRALVAALAARVGVAGDAPPPAREFPSAYLEADHRRYVTASAWIQALSLVRRTFDDDHLFGAAGWSILLDLYVSRWEGRAISVSSACLASGVPPSTALRYLDHLIDAGLIERQPHPDDGRRSNVALTEAGLAKMTRALDGTTKSNEGLGIGHLRAPKQIDRKL